MSEVRIGKVAVTSHELGLWEKPDACYLFDMDTLTEIEAAVETLPAEEKEELLRFIARRLRSESVEHSRPVEFKRSRRGFPISNGRAAFTSADVTLIDARADAI